MGRVFDALQEAQRRRRGDTQLPWDPVPYQDTAAKPPAAQAIEAEPRGAKFLAIDRRPERRLVVLDDQDTLGAERFRLLASQLRLAQKGRALKTLLITSSVTGEGKSLIAANLALAIAKYCEQRIILIDGDPRHASLTEFFETESAPGFSEWLATPQHAMEIAKRHPVLPLWFLRADQRKVANSRLQSDILSHALTATENSFEWVIIDSPPLVLADAAIWMGVTDGCLLISRRGKTPIKELKKALALLIPSKVLGVVLNDLDDCTHKYYHQYYRTKIAA